MVLPNKRKYIMGIEKHDVSPNTPLMDWIWCRIF